MDKITIRAFRATDDQERCRQFSEEHARVLTDLGVSAVVCPEEDWAKDETMVVFVAEHAELGMVAGIRLQRSNAHSLLPLESALATIEPVIKKTMEPFLLNGNAELGALWNAHRFAGRGVPSLLIGAAIASSTQIDLKHMCCFVAEYVAPYCRAKGFTELQSLGVNGRYVYPIPSISSFVMLIPDVNLLEYADPIERHRILSLRVRPDQPRIEMPKKTEILVDYKLMLSPIGSDYKDIIQTRMLYAA